MSVTDDQWAVLKSGHGASGRVSDERKGIPRLPFDKPVPADAILIDLPAPNPDILTKANMFDCLKDRQSTRKFAQTPLNLDELGYLLWATQGVRKVIGNRAYRTVPSAGCCHPFDTYLAITRVEGLEPGIYRYVAVPHKLALVEQIPDVNEKIKAISSPNMLWAHLCPVLFIWAATPYRSDWRYPGEAARAVFMDIGHVSQNLYLSTESIGCGMCVIGTFQQEDMDALLGLDGEDEFTMCCAAIGKV